MYLRETFVAYSTLILEGLYLYFTAWTCLWFSLPFIFICLALILKTLCWLHRKDLSSIFITFYFLFLTFILGIMHLFHIKNLSLIFSSLVFFFFNISSWGIDWFHSKNLSLIFANLLCLFHYFLRYYGLDFTVRIRHWFSLDLFFPFVG